MDEIKDFKFSQGKNNCFEYGALFKYDKLYDSLNNLKIRKTSSNEKRKCDNKNNFEKNNIKSRNIQLNNQLQLNDEDKRNKGYKTLNLNKTENLKDNINNHYIEKKLKNNFRLKNNNIENEKSLSHPKKINFFQISKNNITENSNFKKTHSIKKKINSSSRNKIRKIQINNLINNNNIQDTSEIIKKINLNPIDYLSFSKKLEKLKDENNSNSKTKTKVKLRPKSTQKIESKNIIKKNLIKLSKSKNKKELNPKSRTLSPKERIVTFSKNSLSIHNNLHKYDTLSKNIFIEQCLKYKLKYSSFSYLNTSTNKTNDHKLNIFSSNEMLSTSEISSKNQNKKFSTITEKLLSRNINSDLNITSFFNKNYLISSTLRVKTQIEEKKKNKMFSNKEKSLMFKKISHIKNKNNKNKTESFNMCNSKKKDYKNKKDTSKEEDFSVIEKLKKEYKEKIDLILKKKGKKKMKK